jgi:hypothetical protein
MDRLVLALDIVEKGKKRAEGTGDVVQAIVFFKGHSISKSLPSNIGPRFLNRTQREPYLIAKQSWPSQVQLASALAASVERGPSTWPVKSSEDKDSIESNGRHPNNLACP